MCLKALAALVTSRGLVCPRFLQISALLTSKVGCVVAMVARLLQILGPLSCWVVMTFAGLMQSFAEIAGFFYQHPTVIEFFRSAGNLIVSSSSYMTSFTDAVTAVRRERHGDPDVAKPWLSLHTTQFGYLEWLLSDSVAWIVCCGQSEGEVGGAQTS
jgi:hypothetical protein